MCCSPSGAEGGPMGVPRIHTSHGRGGHYEVAIRRGHYRENIIGKPHKLGELA